MHFSKVILLSIFLFLHAIHAYAENNALATFGPPEDKTEVVLKKQLQDSGVVTSVIDFINSDFQLTEPLIFSFGGQDGPLYDSAEGTIFIPYSFLNEVESRFIDAQYKETGVTAQKATEDALMHTMFHELAHAIIYLYELPVLGKEEDAADSLATILLIEFFNDGQEIALSAADLFDLESNDRTAFENEDFWDEHSLDEQRFYSTLCFIYGSEPDKYAYILENNNLSQQRAELCIEEYEITSESWFRLLKPHMKKQLNLQ